MSQLRRARKQGGNPGAVNHLIPLLLPGKTFFSFRLFSSTSGCWFICSSREQQRQFEHLSKPVFISREKKKKKGNKWYSTVWVNCFKFRSIPVGLRRATHGVRAHFTVIEWKTLSPFQHYILPCSMYPDGISICMHNLQFSSKKLKNLVFANAGTLWLSKVSRAGSSCGEQPPHHCDYAAIGDNLHQQKKTAKKPVGAAQRARASCCRAVWAK